MGTDPPLKEGLKAYETGYGIVVAKDGTLIYHPDPTLVMQKKLSEFEDPTVRVLGNLMTNGGSGVFRYIYKGQKKVAFYQPIPVTGWSVATVVPEAELFASALRLLWVMVGITLVLAVVVKLRGQVLVEAGLVYYLVGFYLLALAVETPMSLPRMARSQSRSDEAERGGGGSHG